MDLLHYWFSNKKNWFNCDTSFDIEIIKLYGDLINYDMLIKQKDIIINTNSNDYIKILETILICDQLTRHKYRNNKSELQRYDNISFELSNYVINKTELLNMYNPYEKCFALMPLRHSNTIKNNSELLDIIKDIRMKTPDITIYNRFYRATLLRLGKLKNNISITNKSDINNDISINQINTILDKRSHLLEEVSNTKILLEDIEKLTDGYIDIINKLENKNYTISISGGVDSMLATFIMSLLKDKYNLKLNAIHINYNNRDTSYLEAELCIRWCKILNIDIYVRKIDEIKRQRDKDRDIYEDVTRFIRLNIYELAKSNIILGHNKDDAIENIFSNIIKSKNYENLYGMEKIQKNICRPMLNITKKEIYEYAKQFKIPYVYDSTPSWSERGKKRDILFPFLNNFDSRLIDGMYNLSQHILDMNSVYDDYIDNCINYECEKEDKKNNNIISVIKTKNKKYNLWLSLLSKICKHFELAYVSHKSIKNFITIINNENYKGTKIFMSNNLYCIYDKKDKYEIYFN